MINAFNLHYACIAYFFCVVLYYSESLVPIMDFIYNYLQLLYDFLVDFSPKDLEKIDEENISKFFASLLKVTHTNYFEIFIEKGELKEKNINVIETSQAINEVSTIDSDFKASDTVIGIV